MPKRRPVPAADGRWPVTITFLEMTERPPAAAVRPPLERIALVRAENPTVAFYRFLYDAVGRDWAWVERKRLSDEELAAIIGDDRVEINVLYVHGTPAGYIELDFRGMPEVADIGYFGIMPEFIGRGLGPFLLNWGIQRAWDREPGRLTVNTCTLDHPKALPLYQRMGFTPCNQVDTMIDPPEQA